MAHSIRPTTASFAVFAAGCLLAAGCETNDPCDLRQAACLDVTLIGDGSLTNMVSYSNVTVNVTAVMGGTPLGSTTLANLQQTAGAGVTGLVGFQFPDSFNALPDTNPIMVIDALTSQSAQIAKMEQLMMSDPRHIDIEVTGTLMPAGKPVKWSSLADEQTRYQAALMGDSDEWLHLGYYRVGLNQFAAAYPLLTPTP